MMEYRVNSRVLEKQVQVFQDTANGSVLQIRIRISHPISRRNQTKMINFIISKTINLNRWMIIAHFRKKTSHLISKSISSSIKKTMIEIMNMKKEILSSKEKACQVRFWVLDQLVEGKFSLKDYRHISFSLVQEEMMQVLKWVSIYLLGKISN